MFWLLLIAGLILVLAGPWFASQVLVGTILLVVAGALLVIQLLVLAGAAVVASKARRR